MAQEIADSDRISLAKPKGPLSPEDAKDCIPGDASHREMVLEGLRVSSMPGGSLG